MLITRLGKARLGLLASFQALDDAQLNAAPDAHQPSPAQRIRQAAAFEQAVAGDILAALGARSDPVPDQAPAALAAALETYLAGLDWPAPEPATRDDLVKQLEATRFRDLQHVFNETHERVLAERSVQHPRFGRISLKNLVDLVWLNDEHQARRIERAIS